MNRPRAQRRKPAHHRTWSGPLASWTDAITRRQHERNACQSFDACAALYLAKYTLLGFLMAYFMLFKGGPIESELLRTLASFFLTLTVCSLLFIAHWWFWPRLAWPWRAPARASIGPYPSPPALWIGLIQWSLLVLLCVVFIMFISAWIALVGVLAFAGMYLILTGIRRRVGHDERCRCGYPATTPRWSRGLCPECARNLDTPRNIILGHDARSPARLTAGTTLVLIALAIIIWQN